MDVALRTYFETLGPNMAADLGLPAARNRSAVTEKNFSPLEMNALRTAIAASQKRAGTAGAPTGLIDYPDYGAVRRLGPEGYADVENTLGGARWYRRPDGAYVVADEYDFDNAARGERVREYEGMGALERLLRSLGSAALQTVTRGPHHAAGELGSAYIGRDGRPVRVVIPPVEKARGGLAHYKECRCGQ